MLAKRIIPCLDVKDGVVVKGVQFKNHVVLGDIIDLANFYKNQGADELVFYDITASSENRSVTPDWITRTAKNLDIPFCVAGGIRTVEQAKNILYAGADKISINSPALENPDLINQMVDVFGSQCIVIGIDSRREKDDFYVYLYTGTEKTTISSKRRTVDWVKEVQNRGAGEIVLNCMDSDGTKKGYDIEQIKLIKSLVNIPVVASGGAGSVKDFIDVFNIANADAGLAAGIFHRKEVLIPNLKQDLKKVGINVRI
jgi:cyclase